MQRQLRKCAATGCKTLVRQGHCDIHKPDARGASKEYQSLYNNTKWRKYRAIYLMKNPFCVICGGRSNIVDHIKDHKGDLNKFWDESNHQAMCKNCHDTKTAKENLCGKKF